MTKARDLANVATNATDAANAIPDTLVDAKGDLIVASAADTVIRVPLGTNNHVLTADSSTTSGVKWASSTSPAESWTLLNTGGTSLTGSSDITVSSINGYNKYYFLVDGASATAVKNIQMRFNGDTGSNYQCRGGRHGRPSSYGNNVHNETNANFTAWELGSMSTSTGSKITANIYLVNGASTTSPKLVQSHSMASADGGTDNIGFVLGGIYNSNSAISSVTVLIEGGGTWDAGTLFIYASTS